MPVLSLACHLPHNTPHIPSRYNNEQTTKQTKAINNSYIYINISCKCDTNRAGHFTLDAYASRPVACLSHYQVPHCIRVFFYFAWFVFIHHNFQFYFELCTYCNILDIYLSQNLNFVNYLLFYMKLLNYLFFNMFGSVLECCELTGVSLLWPWLIKWK